MYCTECSRITTEHSSAGSRLKSLFSQELLLHGLVRMGSSCIETALLRNGEKKKRCHLVAQLEASIVF